LGEVKDLHAAAVNSFIPLVTIVVFHSGKFENPAIVEGFLVILFKTHGHACAKIEANIVTPPYR
jgi:hypothetical protein